jgi:Papain family cysteine protease
MLNRRPLGSAALLALAAVLAFAPAARSAGAEKAPSRLGAGAVFDTLTVGANTYHGVEVRSVNDRTLMISHDKGLAAVRLRDLSPELQESFGYRADAEAVAEAKLKEDQAAQQKRTADATAKRSVKSAPGATGFEQLLQNFGRPVQLQPLVDLRPKFSELALNVKNQGARPSCAVFAIVSALEYQNALLTGKPERFSEEYLVWATCRTLNRAPRARPEAAIAASESTDDSDPIDEGFALSEVVTALRAYGVPLQESLPYSFARTAALKDPPQEVMALARSRRQVAVLPLPGHDRSTVLANLIHALNAGVPVAVGMAWPAGRGFRGNTLNAQPPGGNTGHAVTIVGYENKTGEIADTVFIFKNSWGVRWGAGGYGFASYRYLFNNLGDTAVLDVALGKG